MCELGRFVVGLAVASDGLLRWQKKGIVFEGGGPDGNTHMHTYIHAYIRFKALLPRPLLECVCIRTMNRY